MRHVTRTALAFAAFLALAAATTWPLALAPRERLPDNADALHFAWSTAWVSHQLVRNPLAAFHANIFFPDPAALAYGEPVIGEALLAWPILAATKDAALTYNLLLILTIGLGGFFTFLMVREISANAGAAFLAGEIFALTSANYDSAARIQIVSSQWTPLVFYFLVRLLRGRRVRDGIFCGAAFALQCLSCSYYGLFVATLLVLSVPLLVAMLPRPRLRNVPWRGLAAGIAVATVAVAPAALVQFRQLHSVGAERTLRPGALVGSSYQQTLPTNWVYGARFGGAAAYDDRHFQGFIPPALAAAGLLCLRRRQSVDSAMGSDARRWFVYFAALGVLAYLFACGRDVPLPGGSLPGPYRLLHEFVPGYAQTRVPSRFVMVVRLALAVLAASGAAWLIAVLARHRSAFGAVACRVPRSGLASRTPCNSAADMDRTERRYRSRRLPLPARAAAGVGAPGVPAEPDPRPAAGVALDAARHPPLASHRQRLQQLLPPAARVRHRLVARRVSERAHAAHASHLGRHARRFPS